MNYNLNNNDELIAFFNDLFQNEELTNIAPNIMKFFIITRNYGLINFQDNINKLMEYADLDNLAINSIKNGFQKDNIPFNNHNLLTLVINNYHQNGFYFHSFPGVYEDSIRENGILASNRNNNENKFYEVMKKYNFSNYFINSNKRICVTEKISIFGTHEYSIFTPEWLEIFLNLYSSNVHEAFREGNLEEMMMIAKDSLLKVKNYMMKNPQYNENDYKFLENYINEVVYNRFQNGNDKVGIALVEKQKSVDYFGKYVNISDIQDIEKYTNARGFDEKESFKFITDTFLSGEKNSDKNIPANLINIVSYNIKKSELEQSKTQ